MQQRIIVELQQKVKQNTYYSLKNEQEIYNDNLKMIYILLILITFLLFLGILIISYISRYISSSVRNMIIISDKISSGDIENEEFIKVNGNDELALL